MPPAGQSRLTLLSTKVSSFSPDYLWRQEPLEQGARPALGSRCHVPRLPPVAGCDMWLY